MREDVIRELLEAVRSGRIETNDAVERLRRLPFEDLGFARLDHHRALRSGFPEVIYGPGKSVAQLEGLIRAQLAAGNTVLVTRVTPDVAEVRLEGLEDEGVRYEATARCLVWEPDGPRPQRGRGRIAVVAAGTSDLPVAEEAALTAELMGNAVDRLWDVGVAGLHRLLADAEMLRRATVIVVVAGMEGALPSVVGGLVDCPVVAVPTSVGYGASFGGVAALLGMLNSCAAGVTVVNIDNGFGGGYAAAAINRRRGGD
jgi:pyridinium-3,5-biscarboxylic acid mononucleotide synthase